MDHLQIREARWIFADLHGKHGRIRSVPIPAWVMETLNAWTGSANITAGFIFRAVNKADAIVGDRISAQAIYEVAKTYGYGEA